LVPIRRGVRFSIWINRSKVVGRSAKTPGK
jgi:hypothetical protein